MEPQPTPGGLEFHPVANIFPLLQGDEYEQLKADIARNGLIEPIWLHPDGRIIDGRNRWRACVDTNTNAHFNTWNGNGSLVEFVISLNLHRRHLTPSQAAAIALEVLPMLEEEAKERQLATLKQNQPEQSLVKELTNGTSMDMSRLWQAEQQRRNKGKAAEQAAQLFQTNRQYVSDAKRIQEQAPELLDRVKSGELSIPEAKKELRKQDNASKEQLARDNTPVERLWTVTDGQDVIKCDVLLTDPPYGILDESWEPARLREFTTEWLKRWNDCGADFIISFWSQRYLFDGKGWFDESLTNYRFQQLLIWHYPNNKSPQSRQGFKQTYEPIFFYRRTDSSKQIRVDGSAWGDGLNDFDCHVAAVPQSNFNNENFKQHPAQKPVSVMRWLVNAASLPGELIADPFMGSGTTGIAATQLLRQFLGIENDPEYLELATRRLSTYGR